MNFYLVTFHETDGNDCTVYDCIVEATNESSALEDVAKSIEAVLTDNKTAFEDDGSELGYYFNCSEDCSEHCEGHGGIALRTVEAYPTEHDAENARSKYHTLWTV